MARGADAGTRAPDAALSGTAEEAPRRHRASVVARDRKDLRGRAGRRVARHRSRRARVQRLDADDGRNRRERRAQDRFVQLHPAARRLRRHHAVQLSRDDSAVDVSDGDRVRQHVRVEAVRTGSDDAEPARRTVRRSRRAERCAAARSTAAGNRSTRCSIIRDIKAISFVGSVPVAQHVYRTGTQNLQARAGDGGREEPHGDHAGCEQRAGHQQPRRRVVRRCGPALYGDQRRGVRRWREAVDPRSLQGGDGEGTTRPVGCDRLRVRSRRSTRRRRSASSASSQRQRRRCDVCARWLATQSRGLSERQLAGTDAVHRRRART